MTQSWLVTSALQANVVQIIRGKKGAVNLAFAVPNRDASLMALTQMSAVL
jgi:hypothetical protein